MAFNLVRFGVLLLFGVLLMICALNIETFESASGFSFGSGKYIAMVVLLLFGFLVPFAGAME